MEGEGEGEGGRKRGGRKRLVDEGGEGITDGDGERGRGQEERRG